MNTDHCDVQELATKGPAQAEPDPRVARSTRAVEAALAELLPDVTWRDLTVQQILDRAGVSRGTFYKHYRNKDDALRGSLAGMLTILQRGSSGGDRLFPVSELIDHMASAHGIQSSLGGTERMDRLWEEMREELAVRFRAELVPVPGSSTEAPDLAARVLAGALVELVRYAAAAPAALASGVLDQRFHRMAATTVAAFGCVRGG